MKAGYQPERDLLEKTLAESMVQTLDEIHSDADLTGITSRAERLLSAATLLGLEPELWQVQNRFLNAYVRLSESHVMDPLLHEAFAKLAAGFKVSQNLLGWRP